LQIYVNTIIITIIFTYICNNNCIKDLTLISKFINSIGLYKPPIEIIEILNDKIKINCINLSPFYINISDYYNKTKNIINEELKKKAIYYYFMIFLGVDIKIIEKNIPDNLIKIVYSVFLNAQK